MVCDISYRRLNHKRENAADGRKNPYLGQVERELLDEGREQGIDKGPVEIPCEMDKKDQEDHLHVGFFWRTLQLSLHPDV